MRRSALIIVASDRASSHIYEDISGEILRSGLLENGYSPVTKIIVPDNASELVAAIVGGLDSNIDLILTSGGTGISARDITPEATAPLIERLLPGVPEALRAFARAKIPTSDLSRGLAGTTNRSFIVNLAGSPGAAKDGLEVILKISHHIHDQLNNLPHYEGNPVS